MRPSSICVAPLHYVCEQPVWHRLTKSCMGILLSYLWRSLWAPSVGDRQVWSQGQFSATLSRQVQTQKLSFSISKTGIILISQKHRDTFLLSVYWSLVNLALQIAPWNIFWRGEDCCMVYQSVVMGSRNGLWLFARCLGSLWWKARCKCEVLLF